MDGFEHSVKPTREVHAFCGRNSLEQFVSGDLTKHQKHNTAFIITTSLTSTLAAGLNTYFYRIFNSNLLSLKAAR